MRAFSLITLTVAAGLAAFAAPSYEATYSVGNLDNLSAGAKGTLHTEENALVFHSGKTTVEAPYAKITGTEMGQKITHSDQTFKHKFWQVKNKAAKIEGQSLIVNFKDASGKDQSMTLELSEEGAYDVHNFVDAHSGLTARRQLEAGWWGDDYWKTNRNQKNWSSTQSASAK